MNKARSKDGIQKRYAHWIHLASGRFYLGHGFAGFEQLVKNVEDASQYNSADAIPPNRLSEWVNPKSVLAQGTTEILHPSSQTKGDRYGRD